VAKPTSHLSPAAQAAMPYWRDIDYAAAEKLTTEDMWTMIKDRAEEYGLSSPGVSAVGVAQLRGLATGLQRSTTAFERLADTRSLPGRFWTQAPWARSRAEQRALPKFNVRFQHTFTRNGETVTEWRTSVFETKPPRNVGELRAMVQGDAINLARKYGAEHIGISDLQLLIV
jgi:hypothetical protein